MPVVGDGNARNVFCTVLRYFVYLTKPRGSKYTKYREGTTLHTGVYLRSAALEGLSL
jgi:hypothetical protein